MKKWEAQPLHAYVPLPYGILSQSGGLEPRGLIIEAYAYVIYYAFNEIPNYEMSYLRNRPLY